MENLSGKVREQPGKSQIWLRNRTVTVADAPKKSRLHSYSRRLRVSRDDKLEVPRSPLDRYIPRSGGVVLIRPAEEEEKRNKRVITPPPNLLLKQQKRLDDDSSDEEDMDAERFDGIEVVPNVYFGGEGCAKDSAARARLSVTYVLSLSTEFEAGLQEDVAMSGAHENHRSIRLENAADADLLGCLDACFSFIKEALRHDAKVVVHSLEGRSRSMSVAVAYLMLHNKLTLKEAYRKVQKLSPAASINRGFWRQLHALDILLYGEPSIPEEELPGAIIFEREALDQIIANYARAHRSATS